MLLGQMQPAATDAALAPQGPGKGELRERQHRRNAGRNRVHSAFVLLRRFRVEPARARALTALMVVLLAAPLARAQSPAPLPALPPPPVPAPDPAGRPAPPPEVSPPTGPTSSSPPTSPEPPPPPPQVAPPPPAPPPPSPCRPPPAPAFKRDRFYFRMSLGPEYGSFFGSGLSLSGFGAGTELTFGGSPVPGFVIAGTLQIGGYSSTFHGNVGSFVPPGPPQPLLSPLYGHAGFWDFLLGVAVDWFPDRSKGWHVGASIGFEGNYTGSASGPSSDPAFGWRLSGGHDWSVGRGWGLGLQAVVAGSTAGSLTDANNNPTGYQLTPLSFGLQGSLVYY